MKKIIFYCIFLCASLVVKGQTNLPKVLPPSPEVQALFQAKDYTVNSPTGVPDINIPLYEIKSGSLSVPISISYNAIGRRVTDETGSVGLGWSLNCGGMISRTVYGKPDEKCDFPSPLRFASDLTSTKSADFQYLTNIYYNSNPSGYDTEYDIFSYIIGDKSGKFVISSDKQSAILFPPKPYSIPVAPRTFPCAIMDDLGIKYLFGQSETGQFRDAQGTLLPDVATAKYLSSITSADGNDMISFSYQSASTAWRTRNYVSESGIIIDNYTNGTNSIPQRTTPSATTQTGYSILRNNEIAFRNGKIVFTLDGTSNRIQLITVKDKSANIIKSFMFYYSILDANSILDVSYYKLDSIVARGSDNKRGEKYSFFYNATEPYNASSRDNWGYRNGTTNNSLLTNYNVQGSDNNTYNVGNGGNRSSYPEYAMKGVLNKIVYPTGGSTAFTYEGNQITVDNTLVNGPGIRVSTIKTYDNTGNVTLKTYKYFQGYVPFAPGTNYAYSTYQKRTYPSVDVVTNCKISSYRTRTYSSELEPNLDYLFNQPVYYTSITEYLGTETSNIGKTVYSYDLNDPGAKSQSYTSAAPDNSNSWICANPGAPPALSIDDPYAKPSYVSLIKLYTTPSLTGKAYFANVGSNAQGIIYSSVKSTSYNYQTTETSQLRGFHMVKIAEFSKNADVGYDIDYNPECIGAIHLKLPVFLYSDYYISVGNKILQSTTETQDGVSTTTNYVYNNRNLVSETDQQANASDVIITKTLYPFDAGYNSTAPYNTMVNKNMLNYMLEKNTFKNSTSTPLESITISYKDSAGMINPRIVSEKKGTAAFVPRLVYQKYDHKGNILQIKKAGDITNSFIWGYDSTYVVAKIENATCDDIKSVIGSPNLGSGGLNTYESTLRGAPLMSKARITTLSYTPLVGTITQVDPNGVATHYNYDTYSRLHLVSDDAQNILKSYEYKVINPSIFSEQKIQTFTKNDCGSNSLGSNVDYIVNAGAYSSSISLSDANSKRDADIAANGQNYANQKGYCYAFYNDQLSQTFTKNNCGSGYLGSDVTYTIPANTYFSIVSKADANQKAQNDINTNGQTNANNLGTCRQNVTYYNVAASGTFTKNNCAFGYSGSQVTYTVNAGKYTSTYSQAQADGLAQTDINSNGQNYANTNGTCTLIPTVSVLVNSSTRYDVMLTYMVNGKSQSYTILQGASNRTIYVPQGTYSLQITLVGCSSGSFTFSVPGVTAQTNTYYGSFSNVPVPSGTNTISIY